MTNIIETKNLTKLYRKQAVLTNVSINVEEGTVYGLLGPNGAGKSTLLKLITKVIQPNSGEILFDGNTLSDKELRKMGAIIENPAIYPNLTATENLEVLTTLLGIDKSKIDEVLRNIVYPANYPEKNVTKIVKKFKQSKLEVDDIPYYYDYTLIEDKRVIETTIDKKFKNLVETAKKNGESRTDEIIGNKIFRYFSTDNNELILSYRVTVIPASAKIYRIFGNFELFYIFVLLMIWGIGFMIIISRSYNILLKEIKKISSTNLYIQEMELDFPREKSKYKEISNVLETLDKLAKSLKESLQNQWEMQERQKDLIDSVTHDVRTPITLIKGNIELFKEDIHYNSNEYILQVENGVNRLEKYIDKLSQFTDITIADKEKVDFSVLEYWISLLDNICTTYNRQLNIINKDISTIYLDKEGMAVVLQNIIVNAVEN
ncbi:ATP-binding cassette domain-containing protein [Streptococcus iniae]|nr:ATP-binding cassette domain-containing protein [Streptococcus iniae]